MPAGSKKLNIYVALSGGVDSSVALALLKQQGHDVTGVYFKTYKPDGNTEYCKRQGMDAQRVCEHLGAPFKVFDLQEEYKQKVFEYMIEGYKAGVTPNPDIMCNREIKFGVFAERAFAEGADMIATGHYANTVIIPHRVGLGILRRPSAGFGLGRSLLSLLSETSQIRGQSSAPQESGGCQSRTTQSDSIYLRQAKDQSKDQTYFLSQVRADVLSRTMFPLGGLLKSEVRELAREFGLPTATKEESQGICFIGQEMDVKDFLKNYIPEHPGDVLNTGGTVVGKHKGVRFSTIGERHGFVIYPEFQSPDMPRLYVIKRDVKNNTLTIGTKEELDEAMLKNKCISIHKCNWLNKTPPESGEYKCRIRHRGELHDCRLNKGSEGDWVIEFIEMPYAPAVGQFAAIYDGDICLGGGEIYVTS